MFHKPYPGMELPSTGQASDMIFQQKLEIFAMEKWCFFFFGFLLGDGSFAGFLGGFTIFCS